MNLSKSQLHGITDFLANSLEHFSLFDKALDFMEDEFELSPTQAKKILEKWESVDPKQKLQLGLNWLEFQEWVRKAIN